MPEYPYVLSSPSIERLFDRIKSTGLPTKVDSNWLKTVGFKSGNDTRLLNVITLLGFIDGSRIPTQRWRDYRGANSRTILGNAVKEGYGHLYGVFPDAHNRSFDEILNVVKSGTSLSDDTAKRAVKTFQTIAKLASFDENSQPIPSVNHEQIDAITVPLVSPEISRSGQSPLTINLNVELTLPETTDPKVYEAFFKAMKEHLLSE